MRLKFNSILLSKYRTLPRALKKNVLVQKLFNDTALKISTPVEEDGNKTLGTSGTTSPRPDIVGNDQNVFEEFMHKVSVVTGKRGEEIGLPLNSAKGDFEKGTRTTTTGLGHHCSKMSLDRIS